MISIILIIIYMSLGSLKLEMEHKALSEILPKKYLSPIFFNVENLNKKKLSSSKTNSVRQKRR